MPPWLVLAIAAVAVGAVALVVAALALRKAIRTPSSGDEFRPDVEGLRGMAVLLVVLFHAGLPLPGGFVGVDVFFVISGFLITGLLLRERERSGRIDFLRFYARRVRRLLPAAAVVLLVCLPVAYALVVPLDRPSVTLDAAAAALSVGNIRFALTTGDYFSSIATPSPFLHFWSLGVEEQFYLVWPALLLVASWRRPRTGAAIALGLVLVASLWASVVVTNVSPAWAFYLLPTRAWQLAAGGLLAIWAPLIARVPAAIRVAVGWAGAAALAWAALAFDSSIAYPGVVAAVPTFAAAALIVASVGPAPRVLLERAPLRFLGRISYSLYLWHWPILVLGALAAGGVLPVTGRVGLALVAVVVAAVSWAFIEEPFRRGIPVLTARPARTLAFGLVTIVVVAGLASALDVAGNSALAALSAGGAPSGIAGAAPAHSPTPIAPAGGGIGASIGSASPGAGGTPPATPGTASGPGTATSGPGSPAAGASPLLGPSAPAIPRATAAPAVATPSPLPASGPYALPANVRPPLADARSDEDALRGDGCLAFESVVTPPTDCIFGDPKGSFTVALVGDSHAAALFPAVESVAVEHGWRLVTFTKVACPFIDMRVRDIYLKREYTECEAWRNAVVTAVDALHPDLVLVTMSRWIYPVLAADETAASQGAALGRMVSRLRAGRVAIIDDPPMPSVDVPACLSAHVADIRACSTPRAVAFSTVGVLEHIAAQATGAGEISLANAVCTGNPCPAVVNGMIVYRDTHHLTATFARSLAPALDRGIAAILR